MTVKIHITKWKPGLRKVSMTIALRNHASLSLREAKDCVDRVLDGESVTVSLKNPEQAKELLKELQILGAIVDAPAIQDELVSNTFIDWMEQSLSDILSTPIQDDMKLIKTRSFIEKVVATLDSIPPSEHRHITNLIHNWYLQGYVNGKDIQNDKDAKNWLEGIFGTIDGIIET